MPSGIISAAAAVGWNSSSCPAAAAVLRVPLVPLPERCDVSVVSSCSDAVEERSRLLSSNSELV